MDACPSVPGPTASSAQLIKSLPYLSWVRTLRLRLVLPCLALRGESRNRNAARYGCPVLRGERERSTDSLGLGKQRKERKSLNDENEHGQGHGHGHGMQRPPALALVPVFRGTATLLVLK